MFTAKQSKLFDVSPKQTTSATPKSTMSIPTNPFVKAGIEKTVTTNAFGNGATKLTTTGSAFVDDFGKLSNYKKPRTFAEISLDMQLMWSQDPELAMKELFYVRMITRTVQFLDGTKTEDPQRGQGLRHEGIFRMVWVAVHHPETFWKNITLFIAIGGWKDIITMLSYDLQYNGWNGRKLNWDNFGQLLLAGLENPNTSELIKKYLPQIKASSQCKTVESQADTLIGKWMCSLLFGNKGEQSGWTYKQYRKLKSSGTAHEWQQMISQKKMLNINFNSIHGRALAQLVSGKFLKNQNLEGIYEKWIESKPVAKYTGYVYELLQPVKTGYKNNTLKKYQEDTINKQFLGLIETAKKGMNSNSSFITVVDSSSSMTGIVPGTKVSAYDVAKSMALYFSYLLTGPFANAYMEFANSCEMRYWKGKTPVESLQLDRCEAYGSTNFQSVADTFGRILKTGISESEFPTGIICISDGLFNNTRSNQSNFKELKVNLVKWGFSKEFVDNFKVVLWDIPNNSYGKSQTAFEGFADTPNLYHMSGFDGSGIAFLLGTTKQTSIPKNADELFLAAMDQEVLNMIQI